MLEPGEGIIKNSAMDKINRGDLGNTTHYHAPIHYAPVIQAVDTAGVEKMLDKHGDKFQAHVEKTLRRMNR